jgi:hypothetical protein
LFACLFSSSVYKSFSCCAVNVIDFHCLRCVKTFTYTIFFLSLLAILPAQAVGRRPLTAGTWFGRRLVCVENFLVRHVFLPAASPLIVCILSFFYFLIITIFLHELGRLTCPGIDALPAFPGASTISSPSRSVVQGVFRLSGVVRSFDMVDQFCFLF